MMATRFLLFFQVLAGFGASQEDESEDENTVKNQKNSSPVLKNLPFSFKMLL